MARRPLSEDAVAIHLAQTPGWTRRGNAIARAFACATYADGLAFTNAVARLAEQRDHHPEITLGYRRVDVVFTTHDANGLTRWDFEAARAVTALAASFPGLHTP